MIRCDINISWKLCYLFQNICRKHFKFSLELHCFFFLDLIEHIKFDIPFMSCGKKYRVSFLYRYFYIVFIYFNISFLYRVDYLMVNAVFILLVSVCELFASAKVSRYESESCSSQNLFSSWIACATESSSISLIPLNSFLCKYSFHAISIAIMCYRMIHSHVNFRYILFQFCNCWLHIVCMCCKITWKYSILSFTPWNLLHYNTLCYIMAMCYWVIWKIIRKALTSRKLFDIIYCTCVVRELYLITHLSPLKRMNIAEL